MKLLKRLPVLAPHSAPASATPRSQASCQSGPRRILSLLSGNGGLATRLATFTAATLLGLPQVQAVDYHVTTAQELQNALTLAAANGADDNIYLAPCTNYTGNFNFNSTENRSLVIQGEPGTTNTQIIIDGAGTGRDMSLANTGSGNFTVKGITFLRNCGDGAKGALRIAGGTGSTLLVDSCRFLSPTNTGVIGGGVEIVSGQNATLTNCTAIGRRTVACGTGIQIAGVPGIVAIGGCILSSNSNIGLQVTAGTVSIINNNLAGNFNGISASASGAVTLINNTVNANDRNGIGFIDCNSALVVGNISKDNGRISNNNPYGGLAIRATATVLVTNNLFASNTGSSTDYGGMAGGATINASSTTIVGNSFIGNSSYHSGGLRCMGPAIVSGNTFSGNSGAQGAGGLTCYSSATVNGNSFIGNSTSGLSGGGLACVYGYPYSSITDRFTVSSNLFAANTASDNGGGADFEGVVATVSGNIFKQNLSRSGGAIYAAAPSLYLLDNLITKNSQTSSGSQGGGIWVNVSSNLTMVNNTVTENTAVGSGGGLACSVSGVTEVLNVYNNIIWGNSASGNGADVWLAGTGSKKTFLYNDVHGMYGVWDIAANLLDVAPAFFDPVNGDYHLRSTSPCINAGTNGAPSMPAVDLDGNTRTNGAYVDLGCYEFNNTVFHPADLNHDWVISLDEYTNYATAWKNSQAWSVAPPQIPADYVTRAGYLQNLGGTYHNDGAGAPLCWKTGP
jgi:predicted outer membrane repeat protein